jgi:adenine-specific DNA-methyltransferase
LREDGVIFISIDDNEQANLKLLCDEIFGAENFVAQFPWKKRTAKSDVPFGVSQDYEWIFCYTKSGFNAGLEYERKYYQTPDYPNDGWRLSDLTKQTSAEERPNSAFDMINPKTGKLYQFNSKRVWAVSKDTFQDYYDKGKIVFPDDYDFLNISIPAYRVFESEDKEKALKKYGSEDSMKTASTQLPKEVGMSENGNKEIVELFSSKIFSFPKPSNLIKHFLQIANDKQALVLDFFAGSGTTAHAVLDLNEQDGGNRQFICVQMPEVLDETSEAYKAGYRTIADICKTRISKVVEKIQTERDSQKQSEIPTESKQVLGFKSFKLAPSNFKQWRSDVDEADILAQLELFKDSEQPHSENDAMLVELLLKAGLPLTTKVETHTVAEQTIYSVESSKLLFFFDDYNESVKAFIFTLKPKRVVCLNRVFKNDDPALTNFQLGLKDAGCELQII